MNGKYITIEYGGSTIAGVTADRLNVSSDEIEKASATSSRWKEFLAGRKEWGINSDCLVTAPSAIGTNAMMVGNTYNIWIWGPNHTPLLRGTVICTEYTEDFRQGSLVKGSFRFRGTGPLS